MNEQCHCLAAQHTHGGQRQGAGCPMRIKSLSSIVVSVCFLHLISCANVQQRSEVLVGFDVDNHIAELVRRSDPNPDQVCTLMLVDPYVTRGIDMGECVLVGIYKRSSVDLNAYSEATYSGEKVLVHSSVVGLDLHVVEFRSELFSKTILKARRGELDLIDWMQSRMERQ